MTLRFAVAPSLFLAMAAFAAPALASDGEAGTAGRDAKGFFIAQGDTRLTVGGFAQFRYMVNSRDDAGDPGDLTQGFSFRRVRVSLQGDFSKEWGFRTDIDMNSAGVFGTTADNFLVYKTGPWRVRAGQFKMPLLREELISDTEQMAVERSTLNQVFTGARSQGIDVMYTGEQARFMAMISDGINQPASAFTDEPADFGLTARADVLVEGTDFKQLDSFAGWRGKPTAVMIGGAAHYQDGGETGGTVDANNLTYTADVTAEGSGWSAFAALMGRTVEAGGSDFSDFGWMAQGGYFVTDQTEIFLRFSHVMPDGDRAAGEDFKEVTAGVSHYVFPESTAIKVTADVTIGLDDQASASSIIGTSTANGLLSSGEEQAYFRLQGVFVF